MSTTSFTLCMVTLVVLLATAATATVEIEYSGGRCGGQVQRLSSCQRYLRESSRCNEGGGGWREEFPRCCEALENINEPYCMCQALKKVVEEVGEVEGKEMQEMTMTAQNLPSLCRISPRRSCHDIITGGSSVSI